jgi:hypothetical protein
MDMTQKEYLDVLIEIYQEKNLEKKLEIAENYIGKYSQDKSGFVDELINMRNGINCRIHK